MPRPDIGQFSWHDLMTTDAATAQPFYEALFGWQVIPHGIPGPGGSEFKYPMIHVGEHPVGGIIQENLPEGVPSHWMAYVRVADLDACVQAVTEHGGQVCVPPMDIPGTGRFCVITDPDGAAISPIQLSDPKDAPADGTPGSFCWDELHSKDPARSKAFYSAVFGWEWDETDMGPMGVYHTARGGERGRAGCMQLPAEVQAPAAWMPYVCVEDVDAIHTRASELGASTYVPPSEIPGVGRFAVLADPVGAALAVYQTAPQPA